MANFGSLNLAEQHNLLVKRGAALGLTYADVVALISQYGPLVADLLLKLLEYRRTMNVAPAAVPSQVISTNVLQQLLIQLLTSNEALIAGWLDSGEGAIFDAFVSLVGTKSQLLAALLTQYKTNVIAVTDVATQQLLDEVIALLNGTQPTPAQ